MQVNKKKFYGIDFDRQKIEERVRFSMATVLLNLKDFSIETFGK